MRKLLVAIVLILQSPFVDAQTTAGSGTTVVFPVTAQTGSFVSEVTLFNPGPNPLTAQVTFFEANNSSTPGTKVCSDASVAANRSVQFSIGTQCPLAAGSHFGLLVVADAAQSNSFYGYTRVQNPNGIGFSIEGFPVTNFNNQVSHATGLKRQAAAPTYQTNCFVGSLDQSVNYELRLFNDTTGAQIGNTLTGSLNAFEQYRYLDIFGPAGVNASAGDQFNVRAEFTPTSGGSANLIGFCTVQDNTSFGADFRIAKSYGSPAGNFFAQGGNAFGAPAKLGTLDEQVLEIYVHNQRVMRYEPSPTFFPGVNGPNVIGGFVNNAVFALNHGDTIAGGGGPGGPGSELINGSPCLQPYGCQNSITDDFGTIGGGAGNFAGNNDNNFDNAAFGTVAGGLSNAAWRLASVGGGYQNQALGQHSTVPGGLENIAAGNRSIAMGSYARANANGCFVFSDANADNPTSCNFSNEFIVRAVGGVYFFTAGTTDATYTGAYLNPGSSTWLTYSDRNGKENFAAVDARAVLDALAGIPISTWNWKTEDASIRHMGPVAQDFRAAFGLGPSDKHITTVDADGVALAAIQGLNAKLEQRLAEKDQQVAAQQLEIRELRGELAALRNAVAGLAKIATVAARAD